MTQETEAVTIELAIASCQTCDHLFLISPRRETCPGCGGPAGLIFFEFIGDRSGVHLKDGTLAAMASVRPPSPAEPPPSEPVELAPGEEAGAGEAPGLLPREDLGVWCGAYVGGSDVMGEAELRERFMALGAEPEEAATAVGRLVAVRQLLRGLEAARDLVPEEEDGSAFEVSAPGEGAELVEAAPAEPPEPTQAPEGAASEPAEST